MGTVVTFDLYAPPDLEPELLVQLARARAVLHRVDAVFSTWRPHSPISRLRRGEMTLDEAPAMVAEVLDRCAVARELSDGWFDPWAMPGGLDPTGLVKGWAAARALDQLTDARLTGVIVNAAGDIALRGVPGGGASWRIGIADPLAPRRLVAVAAPNAALATSGTYARGPHLIDPFSGRPHCRAASASVSGPDLALADALATALAVAGADGLRIIERIEGFEGFVVQRDGSQLATPGFPLVPLAPGAAAPADSPVDVSS
jgi:thiamine biosynthesis lipoprotein